MQDLGSLDGNEPLHYWHDDRATLLQLVIANDYYNSCFVGVIWSDYFTKTLEICHFYYSGNSLSAFDFSWSDFIFDDSYL